MYPQHTDHAMKDIQSSPSQVPLAIDTVGVKNLYLPLVVSDRANGHQHTVAVVDIGVELPAHFKGTHMSRFVEALSHWREHLDYRSIKNLLEDVKTRLQARKAYVHFSFPYFITKKAPATGSPGLVSYQCRLTGELADGKTSMLLHVEVPVMTVCPCSKAISDEGAHSQRAMVRISLRMNAFCWLEEFIELAEHSASSPVYTLLKREDEKLVTEQAFAAPTFVEDVVRTAAQQLEKHPCVSWFCVEVESIESIHNHNAFARIEKQTHFL